MTAPMSLEGLVAKWRNEAEQVRRDPESFNNARLEGYCETLDECADDLAALIASQQQGAVAWVRMKDGEIDWEEDCLYPQPGSHDEDAYPPEEGFNVTPLFTNPASIGKVDEAMVERFANSFYQRGSTYEPERIRAALTAASQPAAAHGGVTDEQIEIACSAYHDMAWDKYPIDSHKQNARSRMRRALEALAAAPQAPAFRSQARSLHESRSRQMTTKTQPVDVARLTELLAKVHPGEWWASRNEHYWDIGVSNEMIGDVCAAKHSFGKYTDGSEYAELIITAVNAIPALLQQLSEREAEIDLVRNGLRNRGEYIEGQPPLPLALVAYDHMRIRAEAAERARDEACGLLRGTVTVFNLMRENGDGKLLDYVTTNRGTLVNVATAVDGTAAFLSANPVDATIQRDRQP